MDYYTKYLKYKKKYLNIKNQKGGLIELTETIYSANGGVGYLISPVIPLIDVPYGIYDPYDPYDPHRTNFNTLSNERRIEVSNDTYNRMSIRGHEKVYNTAWARIYHAYGNTFYNNILFDIFQYGLYMWNLHYIFYKELGINTRDSSYVKTELRLIMDCKFDDLSVFIDAYRSPLHNKLIGDSVFDIVMKYIIEKKENDQKFIPKGKLQVALLFYLGQYMKKIINNVNLQNLGIAFQRLKIIDEKIKESGRIYPELGNVLNNTQKMIYYHIETQFKNIKEFIYNRIDEIKNKGIYESEESKKDKKSQFDFLTLENKKYLNIISIQNPSFYDEEDIYRVILTNIDILVQPIKDEDIRLFRIPDEINDILSKM